ncbi:signal recognition particle-docking protein FtsY [Mesorhizobium yinganensis]|uniref:signal recognition particle-docking protein FtsY n=1 Tax=Mesorhizobium yinganensis TaxID=3157707 RepID=UPI003CCD2109
MPAPEPEPEKPAPEVEPQPAPEPEPAPPEVPDEPVQPEPAKPEPTRQPPPEIPHEPAVPEIPTPSEPEQPAPALPEVPTQPAEQPQPTPVEVPPSPPGEVPAPVEIPDPSTPAAPPSPLAGEVPAKQAEGVADEARDSSLQPVQSVEDATPSTAATTPSGPPVSPPPAAQVAAGVVEAIQAGHLPLKGGEEPARASPVVPEPTPIAPDPAPLPVTPPGKVTVGKAVEKKVEPQPAAPAPEPRKSWFQRLRDGLSRSSRELTGSIAGIFTKRKLDEDTLEELEDVLIRADLGMETALRVTDTLASSRYGRDVSDTEVRTIMAQEVEKVLTPVAKALELDLSHKPHVILVVGVNGTGKTTTIGKLAAKLRQGGLSVMLAAGDTFRAAAIEQLKIWGERTGSPVVSSKLGADAAGLAWDAFEKAKEAGSDVLIIDTAGRLQNKAELMAELEKIVRVLGKHDPEAPHTVLQTVDATTGQNALNQVEIFRNVAGVNGLVMTKLDGTARGGILVAIAAKHRLPVYFIGVGEQVDDLEPFSARDFAKAIAGVG